MTELNDLKHLSTPPPTGFTPGVFWEGDTGHVTVAPRPEPPTREDLDPLIREARLDPDKIEVDWSKRTSISLHTNDAGEMVQCWYKLPIRLKPDRTFDVEELLNHIDDHPGFIEPGHGWRTIMLSDQHIGKGALDGGGTEQIIDRWKNSVANAIGDDPLAGINLVFGGDTIEGYVSQHGQNISGTDLTLAEQVRVASRMVAWTIEECLEAADEVIVSVVPGNHGEITRVQNRPMGDNYDVMIVSNAEQAFSRVDTDGRLTFFYPAENEGALTYKAGEATFTIVHGHKFTGGQMNGAQKWWSGQIANSRDPGAAQILLAGHYHNFQVNNFTRDRWIMFAPSLENESTWFANSTGATSMPGALVFDTIGTTPTNIRIC